jgi:hypothetical protein
MGQHSALSGVPPIIPLEKGWFGSRTSVVPACRETQMKKLEGFHRTFRGQKYDGHPSDQEDGWRFARRAKMITADPTGSRNPCMAAAIAGTAKGLLAARMMAEC